MSLKTKPRECSWSEIYKQLQEDKIEFFLNTHLEPMVKIPNDGFQTEWLVDSQRFQDLLVSMYFEISNGGILKSLERDFLIAQIREECRKGGRRLTEPETAETDEDVIVQAVLHVVQSSPKNTASPAFNDRTVVLLQKLRILQQEGKISFREEIPIFTNIFSRRLARLVPVLRGYGVQVDLSHAEDGSRCTLARMETYEYEPSFEQVGTPTDVKQESSVKSSGVKPITGKQMQQTDGADGEKRFENDVRQEETVPHTHVEVAEPIKSGPATGSGAAASTPAKKGGVK